MVGVPDPTFVEKSISQDNKNFNLVLIIILIIYYIIIYILQS